MDSAPEDRLWAAFLTIAEFLDRVWEEDGFLVTIAAAVATLYLFMGNKTDLLLNASFLTYRNLAVVVSIIQKNANYLGRTISSILYVVICHLAVVALLAGKDAWQGPHHPYLIPCRTSHTRLFPKKHSFSYSYLTVGVPVGYKGTMNGLVKTDIRPSTSLTGWLLRPVFWRWFSVQASDHLQRGHDELDLRAKLNNYFKSEVRLLVFLIKSGRCINGLCRRLPQRTFPMPISSQLRDLQATTLIPSPSGSCTPKTKFCPGLCLR